MVPLVKILQWTSQRWSPYDVV